MHNRYRFRIPQLPTGPHQLITMASDRECIISVTVDDGLIGGLVAFGNYNQVVEPSIHSLVIIGLPSGIPNAVASEGMVGLSVTANDSYDHTLSYLWSADCSSWSMDNGMINDVNSNDSTANWTAPRNTSGSTQNCMISVTVDDDPSGILSDSGSYMQAVDPEPGLLSVTPGTDFSTAGTKGGSFPDTKVYTLTNTGGTSLSYSVTKNATWITLSTTAGTLAPDASTDVIVSINSGTDSLLVGPHSGTITFTNTDGAGDTTRGVSLTVVAPGPGVLSVSPGTDFSPSGPEGGPFPDTETYTLMNTGASPLTFSVSSNVGWISLSPSLDNGITSSSVLGSGASTNVVVSIDPSADGLKGGSHPAIITFTNEDGAGDTTRDVSLTVIAPEPGLLSVSPGGDFFASGTQGGLFPDTKTYTLMNTGESDFDYMVSINEAWITLSGVTSGTLAPSASQDVIVSIDPSANNLVVGTYLDTITFTNMTDNAGDTTRAATLSVNELGGIVVSPAKDFNASGRFGKSIKPSSKKYTLINTGNSPIVYSVNNSASWLTISPPSGEIPPGRRVKVTVSINDKGSTLDPGEYSDVLSFSTSTIGVGTATRAVNLSIKGLRGGREN